MTTPITAPSPITTRTPIMTTPTTKPSPTPTTKPAPTPTSKSKPTRTPTLTTTPSTATTLTTTPTSTLTTVTTMTPTTTLLGSNNDTDTNNDIDIDNDTGTDTDDDNDNDTDNGNDNDNNNNNNYDDNDQSQRRTHFWIRRDCHTRLRTDEKKKRFLQKNQWCQITHNILIPHLEEGGYPNNESSFEQRLSSRRRSLIISSLPVWMLGYCNRLPTKGYMRLLQLNIRRFLHDGHLQDFYAGRECSRRRTRRRMARELNEGSARAGGHDKQHGVGVGIRFGSWRALQEGYHNRRSGQSKKLSSRFICIEQ
ncbi:unnamed protein product [Nesidiocoris tenuis]|uniref:Uncharacterized protein n=1 Tax=Nesidiocoris tenuis TaxID=355587 RepID=A0A6H5G4B2_9HEMI|nr:unnamed protein product [Nesidiocoris tenuis]